MSGDQFVSLNLWRPLIRLTIGIGLFLIFYGCDSDSPLPRLPTGDRAIFIVCSGNYGASNARLDIIDPFYTNSIHHSVYQRVNKRTLGGYAHRMAVVDSFGLIAITEKNRLTLINTNNYQHLHSFPIRSPRDVVVMNGKIFVSCYMDSLISVWRYPSFDKDQDIRITHKAGHLAQAGGKIFVMNSDTLYQSGRSDSVITVFYADPPFSPRSVTVGFSPIDAAADPEQQYLYIACKGRAGISGFVAVLDIQTETIANRIGAQEGIRPVRVSVQDSLLAVIASDNGVVRIYDRVTGQIKQVVNVWASAIAFYRGELLIGDAKDYISSGEILWLNANYQIHRRYKTGVFPAHFSFHNEERNR